jgi:SAM-dependent methyltransferase
VDTLEDRAGPYGAERSPGGTPENLIMAAPNLAPETLAEWERVQKIERAYHEQKDPARVLDVNLRYWTRILDVLPPGSIAIGPTTRVLDVGCGGAGMLLALNGGVRTGVDPLMPFYLAKFPFLAEQPIRWLEGTAEQFGADEQFDLIFSLNMLDHTIDPRASAGNIERLLAPGGKLVFVLNVHLTRFWRAYFSAFYRWVDPPHPHHIHIADVPGYFPGLEVEYRRDIDDLWLDLKGFYEEHVLHKKERDRGKAVRKALNPFLYPIAASRLLLGRPVYRKRPGDPCLMATELVLFSR